MNVETINARVKSGLRGRAKAVAKASGLTFQAWIEQAIEKHINPSPAESVPSIQADATEALERVSTTGLHRFKNQYQWAVAKWRLESVLRDLRSIENQRMTFRVMRPPQYLAYLLIQLLRALEPGAKYQVVSSLPFWRGLDTFLESFMQESINAVLRDVSVSRVLIIDRPIWKGPVAKRDEERKLVKQIQNEHRKSKALTGGKLRLRVLFAGNAKEREEIETYFGLFAVLEHDGGDCCVINPEVRDRVITAIDISFSDGTAVEDVTTNEYLARFKAAWSGRGPNGKIYQFKDWPGS